MRILAVSPYIPCPSSGASTRSHYLLRTLASQYDVSLVVLVGDPLDDRANAALSTLNLRRVIQLPFPSVFRRKRLHQLVSILRGRSRLLDAYKIDTVQRAIDDMFTDERYDVVLFESVYMADYRLPPGTQVIVDEHNIEHELLYRMYQREKSTLRKWYNWWESRQVRTAELERCCGAHKVLVTSRKDASLLQPHLPHGSVAVVPNGVAVDAFQPASIAAECANSIIFTGAMDYYPNIDAVRYFADECWPLIRAQAPAATWHVVGKNPAAAVWRLRGCRASPSPARCRTSSPT